MQPARTLCALHAGDSLSRYLFPTLCERLEPRVAAKNLRGENVCGKGSRNGSLPLRGGPAGDERLRKRSLPAALGGGCIQKTVRRRNTGDNRSGRPDSAAVVVTSPRHPGGGAPVPAVRGGASSWFAISETIW